MVSEISVTTSEVLEGTIRYGEANEKLCDDVMVVYVMTGGTEHKVMELYEICKPKALFLVAFPRRNSLPAALEALTSLPRGGLYIVRSDNDISKVRGVARRAERIINSTTVLIGGVANWLVEVPAKDVLKEKFGLRIIEMGIEEMLDAFENAKVSEEEVKGLKLGATTVEVSDEDLTKALKLKKALERVIDTINAKSLAINCFDFIKVFGVTPCLAVALLNSANVPVACEGDLLSLSSMIVSYVGLGKVGGIFNVNDIMEDKVLLSHCTAPLTMLDEYSLVRHYETGAPVAIKGKIYEGRPLMALRVDRELESANVWVGTSVDGPEADACRTQIWMKTRPQIWGNHRVVMDSDDYASLSFALGAFGIKPPNLLYLP